MAITAMMIGRECGVSGPTISRILNGRENLFSPKTVRKVKEAARKHGYRPNRAAQIIRSGRFDSIGIMFPELLYLDIPSEVVAGISETLTQHGFRMNIMLMPEELRSKPSQLATARSDLMMDGFVLSCWTRVPDILRNDWDPSSAPVVLINSNHPLCAVRPDDVGAGIKATEHLLALGHKKIAYVDLEHKVSSERLHFSHDDRELGYETAMRAAGLVPRKFIKRLNRGKIEAAGKFLSEPDRPTAIVGYYIDTVVQFLFASFSLGISVPRDISFIVFGMEIHGPTVDYSVSTIVHPYREIGVATAEMILGRIRDPDIIPPSIAVPFNDIVGKTCVPPPKQSA